jgi:hypothetical protein
MVMSALPPKADMCIAQRMSAMGQKRTWPLSFDHFVGCKQKLRGNGQTERLGGL